MKSQHNYNYNLQLYPTQSNIKLIPISLLVNGGTAIPNAYRFFFDNDAELNNSIITGMSVMARFNLINNIAFDVTPFTITIKGEKDKLLIDSLPLFNLLDIKQDGDYTQKNYRTVKRFNFKPKWDKCYIQTNTIFNPGTELFIYLVVFYKPNGTTNL